MSNRPAKNDKRSSLSPLAPASLYTSCDPASLPFNSTAELEDLSEIVGQGRAVESLRFGVDIRRKGYNVFLMGPGGAGRYSLAIKELEGRAATEAAPLDWCYVNNFEQSHKPKAISLPTGCGAQFQQHMRKFVEELRSVIPAAFESDEYHNRIEALNEEFKQRQEAAIEEFGAAARAQGIALIQTPTGLALGPLKGEEVITPDEFDKLPEEEQQRLKKLIQQLRVSGILCKRGSSLVTASDLSYSRKRCMGSFSIMS
jgi:hypothetical protein